MHTKYGADNAMNNIFSPSKILDHYFEHGNILK